MVTPWDREDVRLQSAGCAVCSIITAPQGWRCSGFTPQTPGNYYPIDPRLFKVLSGWHVVHPMENQNIGA